MKTKQKNGEIERGRGRRVGKRKGRMENKREREGERVEDESEGRRIKKEDPKREGEVGARRKGGETEWGLGD